MSNRIDNEVRDVVSSGIHPQSYLITAGAGAGKTSVLVERISNLILNNVPPESIVAITFTDKAAGELKRRVHSKVYDVIKNQANTNIKINHVRKMFTGTIHSFALRLLQRAPITTDIEPMPNVIQDQGIQRRIKQTKRKWEQKNADMLAFYIENGVIERKYFFELLSESLKQTSLKLNLQQGILTIERIRSTMDVTIQEIRKLLQECKNSTDKLYDKIHIYLQELETLQLFSEPFKQNFFTINNYLHTIRYNFDENRVLIKNVGSKANWKDINHTRESIVLCLNQIADLRKELLQLLLKDWEDLLNDFQSEFLKCLRKNGEVRFDDIISQAVEITKSGIKHNLKYFHLDEAQDTDPILLKLIQNLIQKGDSIVFIVGDEKQSIYSFRKADVKVFRETMYEMIRELNPQNPKQVLHSNFRSTPQLIKYFNNLYSDQWQDQYEPMETGNTSLLENKDKFNPAILFFDAPDSLEMNIEELNQWNAEQIAIYFDGCRTQNPSPLPKDTYGNIAWNEIAILFPSTTHVKIYSDMLKKYHIPFVEEHSRDFFKDELVIEVINAMNVIANPKDGVALLATLRGKLFGVSDYAIWEWRNQLPKNEIGLPKDESMYLNPSNAIKDEKLNQALVILSELVNKIDRVTPSVIIQELYHKSKIVLNTYQEGGVAQRGRLQAMITLARRMQYTSFTEIANELRESISNSVRVENLVSSEEPAVRLMTVHGAKGLEFDWVVVAGVAYKGGRDNHKNSDYFLQNDDQSYEIKLQSWFQTNKYQLRKEEIRRQEEEENVRVIYVAMTRARKKLLLPVALHKKGKSVYADWKHKIREAANGISSHTISILDKVSTKPEMISYQQVKSIQTLPKVSQHNPTLKSISTEIEHSQLGFKQQGSTKRFTAEEAIQIGTIAHHLLQVTTDNDTDSSILHKLDALFDIHQTNSALMVKSKILISKWIQNWYASELFNQIKKYSLYHEFPITQTSNENLWIGIIDLFVESDNQCWVIDFKSDETTENQEKHKKQIQHYCQAIQQEIHKPVGGYIWYLHLAKSIQVYQK